VAPAPAGLKIGVVIAYPFTSAVLSEAAAALPFLKQLLPNDKDSSTYPVVAPTNSGTTSVTTQPIPQNRDRLCHHSWVDIHRPSSPQLVSYSPRQLNAASKTALKSYLHLLATE